MQAAADKAGKAKAKVKAKAAKPKPGPVPAAAGGVTGKSLLWMPKGREAA